MKLVSISHGSGFPPGAIYDVSEELGRAQLNGKLAQKLISVEGGSSVESLSAPELREVVQGPDLPPWDKRVSPKTYLQRYPNAPFAEVAQLYVDAGLGEVKGG